MNEALRWELISPDDLADSDPEYGPLCICQYPANVPEMPLLLEISDGQAHVTCSICKQQFAPELEPESFQMDPIPVRLRYERTCGGPPYCSNGWLPCDHDDWFVITPRTPDV